MSKADRFFENIATKAKVLGLGMFMFFSGQSAAAQAPATKDKAQTQKHTLAPQSSKLTIHGVRLATSQIQPADITHAYNTSKALQKSERGKQWHKVSSRFAALEKAGWWRVTQSDYASQDQLFAYKTFVTTTAGYPLGKVVQMLEQAQKEVGSKDASKISAKVYDLLIAQSSKYKRRFVEEKNSVQAVMNYINRNGSTKVLTLGESQTQKQTSANKASVETTNCVHVGMVKVPSPTTKHAQRQMKEPIQLVKDDKMSDHVADDSTQILHEINMSRHTDKRLQKNAQKTLERIAHHQALQKQNNDSHLLLDDDLQAQFNEDLSKLKSGGIYHGGIKINFADMKTASSFAWVWESGNNPEAYNNGSADGNPSLGLFQFNLKNTMRTFMKKYGQNHPTLYNIYKTQGFSPKFRKEWGAMHGTYEKDPVKKAQMFIKTVAEQDEHMWTQYSGPFAYFGKTYQKDNFPLITKDNRNDEETMTLVAAVKMAINQGPRRIYKIVSLGMSAAKEKYGPQPTAHQLAHEISMARIKVWPKYANRYKDETKMLDDYETWRVEKEKLEAHYQSLQQERNLLAQNSFAKSIFTAETSSTRVTSIHKEISHHRTAHSKPITMKQLFAKHKLQRLLQAEKA